ncbi:MAG TPA: bifunctional riboflavin kinase/FAD synthetase [Dongiaceae bacterium]|nr:bifunctional riboflavin kinase/FAD synthetase [Dongiaceae bacterium]
MDGAGDATASDLPLAGMARHGMRLIRHYQDVPAEARRAVVALGNFDGVHLGHQQVLATTAGIAQELKAPLAVMTFEPHPRSYFRPDQPAFRLTPFRIKMRHLQALGVDFTFNLPFDAALAAHSAEAFVREVVVEGLHAAHIVVGYDFCFGRNRGGNVDTLRDFGRQLGFGVTAVGACQDDKGAVYSSTLIRDQLLAGDPAAAAVALGRPWEIEGRVEHGDKRGRQLGFPTANVALGDYLEPRFGVYVVKAAVDDGEAPRWIGGVANLGRRPTVGGTRVQLEVNLFDFQGDLYGKHLRVAFLGFIRPEMKFAGLDQLKAQIAADSATARQMLTDYAGPQPGHLPVGVAIPETTAGAQR